MLVVTVIIVRGTSKYANNDRCKDHDNLHDRSDGNKDDFAIGLFDLGQEVVRDLGVLVTAVINKRKRVDGFVSLHELLLLPEDKYDDNNQNDHLDAQAASNRSLHVNLTEVLLLALAANEAECHDKCGKEANAIHDSFLDDHCRLVEWFFLLLEDGSLHDTITRVLQLTFNSP